jgi:hypothetical protein
METRTLRLLAFALLVLVVLAGWLVYRSFALKENTPPAQNTNNENPNKPYAQRVSDGFVQKPKPVIADTTERAATTSLDFDQVFDAFEPLKNIAKEIIPPNTPITPYAKPKIQKQETVKNLFPIYYIASLRAVQDGFVRAGWLQESDNTSFETEEDVFKFLERGLDAMIEHKAYGSEQEIERARYAVRQGFPAMWQKEREIQAAKQAQSSILYFLNNKKPSKDLARYTEHKKDILDGLFSAFLPPSAQAQADLVDTFVTLPDCWKSKQRPNYKGGDNLFSFCCNCGLCVIPPYRVEFKWDCGKPDSGGDCGDTKCNVPLGCLNAVCGPPNKYNAIFDGPPGYEVPAVFGWTSSYNFEWKFTCGCDR